MWWFWCCWRGSSTSTSQISRDLSLAFPVKAALAHWKPHGGGGGRLSWCCAVTWWRLAHPHGKIPGISDTPSNLAPPVLTGRSPALCDSSLVPALGWAGSGGSPSSFKELLCPSSAVLGVPWSPVGPALQHSLGSASLPLPPGYLWALRTSSPPASVAPAEHHFDLAAFPSLCPTCSIQLHVGTSPHFVLCSRSQALEPPFQQMASKTAHSSAGSSSRGSCPTVPVPTVQFPSNSGADIPVKKVTCALLFFLLHCYVPCHTCPAFHPAAGTGCFFYSPLAIQP